MSSKLTFYQQEIGQLIDKLLEDKILGTKGVSMKLKGWDVTFSPNKEAEEIAYSHNEISNMSRQELLKALESENDSKLEGSVIKYDEPNGSAVPDEDWEFNA